VTGTLTDGKIIVDTNGIERKNFDVQDGFGLVFARNGAGNQDRLIFVRGQPGNQAPGRGT